MNNILRNFKFILENEENAYGSFSGIKNYMTIAAL